jgi:mono/diheme cytochrome c family protein
MARGQGGQLAQAWMIRIVSIVIATIVAMLALAACGKTQPPEAVERGRLVYVTHCVVCHNPNPNLDGAQGPAIAGSAHELVADRVLHLNYPPGYTPKRATHNMRAMTDLTPGEIDDLTAYLGGVAKP